MASPTSTTSPGLQSSSYGLEIDDDSDDDVDFFSGAAAEAGAPTTPLSVTTRSRTWSIEDGCASSIKRKRCPTDRYAPSPPSNTKRSPKRRRRASLSKNKNKTTTPQRRPPNVPPRPFTPAPPPKTAAAAEEASTPPQQTKPTEVYSPTTTPTTTKKSRQKKLTEMYTPTRSNKNKQRQQTSNNNIVAASLEPLNLAKQNLSNEDNGGGGGRINNHGSSIQKQNTNIITTPKEAATCTTTPVKKGISPKEKQPDPEPSRLAAAVRQCWVCRVDLVLVSKNENNSNEKDGGKGKNNPDATTSTAANNSMDNYCLYETHAHPALDVPVCCLCRDALLLAEHNNETTVPGEREDVCIACAGAATAPEQSCDDDNSNNETSESTLLLCDGCNRGTCAPCLELVHGGHAAARALVRGLVNDDNATPWYCPACRPPATLQAVQLSQQPQLLQKPTTLRTVERVLQELRRVLDEQENTGEQLEQEDVHRNAIRQELLAQKKKQHSNNDDELEAAVEAEWAAWKEEWERHDWRLESTVASLHDELETQFHIDLAKLYRHGDFLGKSGNAANENGTIINIDDDDGDDEERLPLHVRKANHALNQRDAATTAAQQASNRMMLLSSLEAEEDYGQVEELFDEIAVPEEGEPQPQQAVIPPDDNSPSNIVGGRGRGFASVDACLHVHPPEGATAAWREDRRRFLQLMEQAQKQEDAVLQRRNVPVTKQAEEQDEEELVGEQQAEVVLLPGGRRIRRSPPGKVTVHESSPIVEQQPWIGSPAASPSSDKENAQTFDELGESESNEVVSPERVAEQAVLMDVSPQQVGSTMRPKQNFVNKSPLNLSASLSSSIYVEKSLSNQLKGHQREGVQFLWKNAFSDLVENSTATADTTDGEIGGCLLAHNMGLGKSLTTITTLHTALLHPAVSQRKRPRTVLLVVPKNTLANWEEEFQKWTGALNPTTCVLSLTNKDNRCQMVSFWQQRGGIMLTSGETFRGASKFAELQQLSQPLLEQMILEPDILVIDEIHTMLSNDSKLSAALNNIQTKRRIGLSGTPLQNNLVEYFRILNFLRPGVFGFEDVKQFQNEFEAPIMQGLHSDSTLDQVKRKEDASKRLTRISEPYVHRKDVSELKKDVPPLHEVVIHVRQSRLQMKLYRAYQKSGGKDFFKTYWALLPVHNHPAILLSKSRDAKHIESEEPEEGELKENPDWWKPVAPEASFKSFFNGYKIVLLMNILAYAQQVDEKVLVFTQSRATLSYIESVLSGDWGQSISSVNSKFPGNDCCRWAKNKQYLRLDGDTSAAVRGTMVRRFNTESSIRLFLISLKAGGIGINLTAANRVVVLEPHFNPAITNQAIFRTYRYGQTRPVYVYRFLTEGTNEEKVYSRLVNKVGVALRVIDRKTIKRHFSEKELQDLQSTLEWVQCDKCEKWRMLLGGEKDENLPDQWVCSMNTADPRNNTCQAPERHQTWYEANCFNPGDSVSPGNLGDHNPDPSQWDRQQQSKDEVFQHLLTVTRDGKKKPLISRHQFHESLLKTMTVKDETHAIGQGVAVCCEELSTSSGLSKEADDLKSENHKEQSTKNGSPSIRPGQKGSFKMQEERSSTDLEVSAKGADAKSEHSFDRDSTIIDLCDSD